MAEIQSAALTVRVPCPQCDESVACTVEPGNEVGGVIEVRVLDLAERFAEHFQAEHVGAVE